MRIRQVGDPILRQVSEAVSADQIGTTKIVGLIDRMKETLDGIKSISDENGNALSAPQLGSLIRLIVLRIDGEFEVMINPVFKASSSTMFEFEEECFSLYDQRGTLERYYEGEVTYLDQTSISRTKMLSGEMAGLVQHEIDHLDGVLFLDRLEQAGREAHSIDELLKDDPKRLQQVRAMMSYMTS